MAVVAICASCHGYVRFIEYLSRSTCEAYMVSRQDIDKCSGSKKHLWGWWDDARRKPIPVSLFVPAPPTPAPVPKPPKPKKGQLTLFE